MSFWLKSCFSLFILHSGIEDFEDKIDKIAGGDQDKDVNSWINKLYQTFTEDESEDLNSGATVNIENTDLEGLEPPILDDTWGLDEKKPVGMKNYKYQELIFLAPFVRGREWSNTRLLFGKLWPFLS